MHSRRIKFTTSMIYRNYSKEKTGNKKGSAYVLALTALLVGLTFALATLRSGSSLFIAEKKRMDRQAAINVAEAGIDYAYWLVHYQRQGLPFTANQSMNNGTFQINVTDNGINQPSTMLITSTGTSNGYTHTMKRIVMGPLPYEYGICSNDPIDTNIRITSTQSGPCMRSNGYIALPNSGTSITTGVWSRTYVSTSGNIPTRYTNCPPIYFPEINLSYYQSIATKTYNYGATFSGVNFPSKKEIIYVNGNVNISGIFNGKYTIVSSGFIDITSSLTPADSNSYIALISPKSIELKLSAANLNNVILYCYSVGGSASIEIDSSPIFNGCMASNYIDMQANIT